MTGSLDGKRIVLIGGAGFIGHNLALSLVSRGAHVEVIDSLQVNNLLSFASARNRSPNQEMYLRMLHQRLDLLRDAGVPLHPMDARDYHILSRVCSDIQPQVVVHLAAVAHAGTSNKDPYSTFDHGLRTLENALDWSRHGIERFIYFSSSMVYGDFRMDEVVEEHPLDPIGIYGALKLSGEKIVVAYNQVFGLPYTIIRPSALYGPRCVSRRVGQIFIESSLAGKPLRVDGDGTDLLDFTCVDDLIEGVCLAIEKPTAINQTFNLTYGRSRSIAELVEVMRTYFPNIAVERVERDKLMPHRGTLSVAKARSLLGYSPRYPIEEGFDRYIQWYRAFTQTPGSQTGARA